jgi:serine/threonine protein kinase
LVAALLAWSSKQNGGIVPCYFGVHRPLTLSASRRGTDVAIKRVLPAEENDNDPTTLPSRSKSSGDVEMGKNAVIRMLLSDGNSMPLGKSPVMSLFDTSSAYMVKMTSMGVSDSGTMRSGSAAGVKGRNLMKLRSDFVAEMRLLSRLRHPNITTVMVGNNTSLRRRVPDKHVYTGCGCQRTGPIVDNGAHGSWVVV